MDDAAIYTLGKLPVSTSIAEELGIVEVFIKHLDWDETQCTVSPGNRLLTILGNLLTEGKPLYQLQQFYGHTDTENLFGEGVQSSHLNDYALGRALDKFAGAAAGPKHVFGTALLDAAKHVALDTSVLHAATTSFSVQGDYEPAVDTPINEGSSLDITHGFSKDKRPVRSDWTIGWRSIDGRSRIGTRSNLWLTSGS